jgi:hypothetical protein
MRPFNSSIRRPLFYVGRDLSQLAGSHKLVSAPQYATPSLYFERLEDSRLRVR